MRLLVIAFALTGVGCSTNGAAEVTGDAEPEAGCEMGSCTAECACFVREGAGKIGSCSTSGAPQGACNCSDMTSPCMASTGRPDGVVTRFACREGAWAACD